MDTNSNLRDPAKEPLFQHESPSPRQDNVSHLPVITGWPTEPQIFPRGKLSIRILSYLIDIVTAFSPVLFLVLAFMAYKLDGEKISPKGEGITKAAKIGTTIYPIIFSAVLGQAMKSVARWRAEKGTSLGVLELLMGSQTLGGTLITEILTLGSSVPVVLGFILVVLWLLSPLGGQASLNLIRTTDERFSNSTPIRYLDTESQKSSLGSVFSPDHMYNALYSSTLLIPESLQRSSMDSWGNLKIPVLELLSSSAPGEDGWILVDTQNVSFASLIGVPIAGIPSEGFTNFTLETTYFAFDCPFLKQMRKNDTSLQGEIGFIYKNVTDALSTSTFFLETVTPIARSLTPDITPRNIIFGSQCNSKPVGMVYEFYTIANCTITQSYVEVQAECEAKNCMVTHIRRSRLQHDPAAYTSLDKPSQGIDFFAESFPLAGRSPDSEFGFSSMTERFIHDPSNVTSFTDEDANILTNTDGLLVDIYELPNDVFTTRFSLVFNTYWTAALSPQYLSGNLPADLNELSIKPNNWWVPSSGGIAYEWYNPTNLSFAARESIATTVMLETQYICNRMWLWILISTTSTLLIAAIVGTFLKWLCVGPDMLGYVSSLTVNNPYITLPPGGCTLDGSERAKLVAGMRVGLVDVDGNKNIGHIAFSSLSGPHAIRRLEEGRPYMGH